MWEKRLTCGDGTKSSVAEAMIATRRGKNKSVGQSRVRSRMARAQVTDAAKKPKRDLPLESLAHVTDCLRCGWEERQK